MAKRPSPGMSPEFLTRPKHGMALTPCPGWNAVFSFLYFLKIKISKIYVRFEIFQKYTPVALP